MGRISHDYVNLRYVGAEHLAIVALWEACRDPQWDRPILLHCAGESAKATITAHRAGDPLVVDLPDEVLSLSPDDAWEAVRDAVRRAIGDDAIRA